MDTQYPHVLFQDLETQYGLQNTSEETVNTIANIKTFKHREISFKILTLGADTCANPSEVFKTLPIIWLFSLIR